MIQVGGVFLNLSDLVGEGIEKLQPHVNRRFYRPNDPIVNYGQTVDYLYYLAKGRVKVVNINAFGQEKTFSYIDAGFFLCEPLFFTKSISSGLVLAAEPCEIWSFTDYYVKHELLTRNPEIALQLLESMSTKLVGIFQFANGLSMKDPKKALAQMVCSLVEGQGQLKEDGTWFVPATMTHQQLADFLGLHRVTVTTTLNKFKTQGILSKSKKAFIIYDLDYLKNLLEV